MQRRVTITGVVLAGGRGSRMNGQDKGLMILNGRELYRHVAEVLRPQVDRLVISANRHIARYRQSGLPVIEDSMPGYQGPLAGMLAVMEETESEWFLFSPCDTPNIPADLFSQLWQGLGEPPAAAVWVNDGERDHPGTALVHHSVQTLLKSYLSAGERRVMQFLRRAGGHAVLLPDAKERFTNINTPDELCRHQEPGQ